MKRTFILSDAASENSYGFRVNVEGMDITRFLANPVMLYNHDVERVIGCWVNPRKDGNKLVAEADIDTGDATGKEVSRKVEAGYLKGCSVGIIVKKMIDAGDGLVVAESELLEASIVAVPSDASAIRLYDENNTPTTIEQVRLNYNFNKTDNMDKNNIELTAATLTALGVEQDVTPQAVEQAIADKDERIATLEAKIETFEKARVAELIDRAVAEKKIGADEKDTYTALAEKDYTSVAKILSKMTGVAPVAKQLNAQGAASKYSGKTWDELDKSGMLASLKAEAPEQYEVLYKEKFNIN